MENACQEHSKLTTQIEHLTEMTKEISGNIKQLLITTAESKVDRSWIKKELGKVWGVIMVMITALIGGAIKMIFFP